MYITHLTRKIGNIKSILLDGFIYVPNPTIIWENLFDDIGFPIPEIENGMISFTNLSENFSADFPNSYMQTHFGEFGIVVDYNWALDNGLKKVAYIQRNGIEYDALKALLKESIPKNNLVHEFIKQDELDRIHKMFLNNPNLPNENNPLFSLLINLLQWIETDSSKEENEYRIRTTRGLRSSGDYTKLEYVDLFKIIGNTLKINSQNILFLICPNSNIEYIKKELENTEFKNIKINGY